MIAPSTLFLSLILGLELLCGGCSGRPDAPHPPAVHWGQTACSQCGMIASDERYAAASVVRTPAGEQESRVFDDIGCLLAYETEHADEQVLARYVKDFQTRQWVSAGQAAFVRGKEIASPMGFGLLAVEARPQAEALAANHHGQVFDFLALRANGAGEAGLAAAPPLAR